MKRKKSSTTQTQSHHSWPSDGQVKFGRFHYTRISKEFKIYSIHSALWFAFRAFTQLFLACGWGMKWSMMVIIAVRTIVAIVHCKNIGVFDRNDTVVYTEQSRFSMQKYHIQSTKKRKKMT